MKRFLLSLIVALLALSAPACAAPSAVQSNVVTSSNTPSNTLSTSNLTTATGNTLVALWNNFDGGGLSASVADTPNGSYTAAVGPTDSTGATISTGIWYKANTTGLSSQPITGMSSGGGNFYQTLGYIELGGVTSTPLDALGGVSTTLSTGSPSISTSGATTQASEIAIAYFTGGTPGTITEASGWTTLFDSCNMAGFVCLHAAYIVLSSTGTVTYAPTTMLPSVYAMAIATFKASGGATISPSLTTLGAGPG